MECFVKRNAFMSDRFSIYDKWRDERYLVRGRLLRNGKKLQILDLGERELVRIKKVPLSIRRRYCIYVQGVYQAEVVKRLTLFRQAYKILDMNWKIDGEVTGLSYEIKERKTTVASVSKAAMSWTECERISIVEEEHSLTALAVALIIKAGLDSKKKQK